MRQGPPNRALEPPGDLSLAATCSECPGASCAQDPRSPGPPEPPRKGEHDGALRLSEGLESRLKVNDALEMLNLPKAHPLRATFTGSDSLFLALPSSCQGTSSG